MEEIIVILIIVVGPFVAAWVMSKLFIIIYECGKIIYRIIKVMRAGKTNLFGRLIKDHPSMLDSTSVEK